MKTTQIATVVAAAATAGIVCAPLASADAAEPAAPSTQSLGGQAKLVNGDVIQGWTISNLQPSSDTIPHQVNGTLWEATATDQALQGSVTPIVSNINARAADGQTYRALFGAATPQGVNPATIPQGEQTSGKVYFDVTGSTPSSVVYNSGGDDLAVWTQAPPSSTRGATPYRSYPSTSSPAATPTTATPAAMPGTTAPEGTAAAPTPIGAEVPAAGSQGTPFRLQVPPFPRAPPVPAGTPGAALPAGTQGTPVPAGSQGTPLAPGQVAPAAPAAVPPAQGAPLPASNQVAPQPAGSQGTPLPQGGEQVPTPTIYQPTP